MDRLSISAAEGATGAGFRLDAGAALLVELDGPARGVRDADRAAADDLPGRRRVRGARRRRRAGAGADVAGAQGRRSPRWAGSHAPTCCRTASSRARGSPRCCAGSTTVRRFRAPGRQRLPRRRRQPAPDRLLRLPRPRRVERAAQLAGEIMAAASRPAARSPASTASASTSGRTCTTMFSASDLEAFDRLRRSFDPAGLANPGKLMPGAAHVRRDAAAGSRAIATTGASRPSGRLRCPI